MAKKMEEKDQLHKMLSDQYDLVRKRTDALSDRAHALLGFSGIVNAILVALIAGAIKEETRVFLAKYVNARHLEWTVIGGFLFYMMAMVFSVLAYRTTKYMPVPQLDSKEFVEEVFSGKTSLSMKHVCLQIVDAIEFHDKVNSRKYVYLLVATLFLLVAFASTGIIGVILLMSIN